MKCKACHEEIDDVTICPHCGFMQTWSEKAVANWPNADNSQKDIGNDDEVTAESSDNEPLKEEVENTDINDEVSVQNMKSDSDNDKVEDFDVDDDATAESAGDENHSEENEDGERDTHCEGDRDTADGDESDSTSDKCESCGEEIGLVRYCPYCGHDRGEMPEHATVNQLVVVPKDTDIETATPPVETPRKKTDYRWGMWGSMCFFLVLFGLVSYGVLTAVHWEKVDHPETFHTERRATGAWVVTMDDSNPCYVGQDWTDCTNMYIDEYNSACANRPLTLRSQSLCSRYSEMIDDMEARDAPGYYVASLGSWGHLHPTEEFVDVQVSNNDYQAHEAVCYYGFIGECK